MQFRFDEAATVEAAAYLLALAGGRLNYTVLIKMLYLADRQRFAQIDSPLTGATYYSMPSGPVLGEVLDLIYEQPEGPCQDLWCAHIERQGPWDVQLLRPAGTDHLSRGDQAILDAVFARFGKMSHGQIIQWCHDNLPEWQDPRSKSKDRRRAALEPEDILRALGRTKEQIAETRKELAYYTWVDDHVIGAT